MNTHPHIAARFVTELDTETLIDAIVSDAFTGHEWRLLRVLLLTELAYRLRLREPGLPEKLWREAFGTRRPVPPGFRSPSEAWPTERRWAH
jgi:hypothetical protein